MPTEEYEAIASIEFKGLTKAEIIEKMKGITLYNLWTRHKNEEEGISFQFQKTVTTRVKVKETMAEPLEE